MAYAVSDFVIDIVTWSLPIPMASIQSFCVLQNKAADLNADFELEYDYS